LDNTNLDIKNKKCPIISRQFFSSKPTYWAGARKRKFHHEKWWWKTFKK